MIAFSTFWARIVKSVRMNPKVCETDFQAFEFFPLLPLLGVVPVTIDLWLMS